MRRNRIDHARAPLRFGPLGPFARLREPAELEPQPEINGRGLAHITAYGEMRDVEIAWLVDPDSRLFASRIAAVKKLAGNTPECVQDFRRVLDDKTLDAVSIVTPDHWHALLTIWACQAGKDVHVEKPRSHNIAEGRKIVGAARKLENAAAIQIAAWACPAARLRCGTTRT